MTITATTEITEDMTRSTRLQILQAQVCQAREDLCDGAHCDDLFVTFEAVQTLATLLQHTLQELANLAVETSPR